MSLIIITGMLLLSAAVSPRTNTLTGITLFQFSLVILFAFVVCKHNVHRPICYVLMLLAVAGRAL